MAIAYDAAVGNKAAATSSTGSLVHAANVWVVIAIAYAGATSPNAVTVGGATASLVTSSKKTYTGSTNSNELWIIERTSSGTETVSVGFAASTRHAWNSVSYTGCAGTYEGVTTNMGTSSSPATSTVTPASGTSGRMLVCGTGVMQSANATGSITMTCNRTQRNSTQALAGTSSTKAVSSAIQEYQHSAGSQALTTTDTKSSATLYWTTSVVGLIASVPQTIAAPTATATARAGTAASSLSFSPNAAGDESYWGGVGVYSNLEMSYTGETRTVLFNIPDHSTQDGSISNVAIHISGYLSVNDGNVFYDHIKTHSATYDGSNRNATSGTEYVTNYATNPNTGVAWTWAEIDALQVGAGFNNQTGTTIYVTAVWAVVDYYNYALVGTGIQSALQAYYKFDENTGTAVGSSTGQNCAIFSGSGNWGTGKINSGGVFNGSSDHVDTASFNNKVNWASISVQAWVKTTDITSYPRIVANAWTDSANTGFELWELETDNKFAWTVGNGTTNQSAYQNSAMSFDTWYHVVGTYDGANVKLYVNGTLQTTQPALTGSIALSTYAVGIGYEPPFNSAFVNGSIDEVALWDRALTQTEVTALYGSGSGLQHPFVSGTSVTVVAPTATVTSTGNAPATSTGISITVPTASTSNVAGNAPVLNTKVSITSTAATVSSTGNVPAVSTGTGVTTAAPTASTSNVSGNVPVLNTKVSVASPVATVNTSGNIPVISAGTGRSTTAPTATVTATASSNAPVVSAKVSVASPTGTVNTVANAPAISAGTGRSTAAPTGTVTTTGNVPVLNTKVSVVSVTATVTSTANTPVVSVANETIVIAPTASVTAQSNVPVVTSTSVLAVPTATVTSTGNAPATVTGAIIVVSVTTVTATADTPTVVAVHQFLGIVPTATVTVSATIAVILITVPPGSATIGDTGITNGLISDALQALNPPGGLLSDAVIGNGTLSDSGLGASITADSLQTKRPSGAISDF